MRIKHTNKIIKHINNHYKKKKKKNQTPVIDEQTNPNQNKNKANSFRKNKERSHQVGMSKQVAGVTTKKKK
jgi:hypothetical protein